MECRCRCDVAGHARCARCSSRTCIENGYRQVYENTSPAKANVETFDQDHTFIVGSKMTVIPDKLFLDINYTFTKSTSVWGLNPTSAGSQYPGMVDYPAIHNTMNRIDGQVKYMLDDTWLHNSGFAGESLRQVPRAVGEEREQLLAVAAEPVWLARQSG